MAQARNPKSIEAERLYREEHMPLVDIAKRLGAPDSTVRRWKSDHDWDEKKSDAAKSSKKKQSERSVSKSSGSKPNARKKQGGQPGNKNATGKHDVSAGGVGAPLGNTRAVKHGAFSRAMQGILSGDELEAFNDVGFDSTEAELMQTYAMLNSKEVRLTMRIMELREQAAKQNGLMVKGVRTMKTDEEFGLFGDHILDADTFLEATETLGISGAEDLPENVKLPHKIFGLGRFDDDKTSTVKETTTGQILDYILKLEAELDKVHSRKIKILSQLESVRLAREKFEFSKKQAQEGDGKGMEVNAWVKAVMATCGHQNDGEDNA